MYTIHCTHAVIDRNAHTLLMLSIHGHLVDNTRTKSTSIHKWFKNLPSMHSNYISIAREADSWLAMPIYSASSQSMATWWLIQKLNQHEFIANFYNRPFQHKFQVTAIKFMEQKLIISHLECRKFNITLP